MFDSSCNDCKGDCTGSGGCGTRSYRRSKGILILRLALGVIFIMHGYDKLFGATGIEGFSGFLASLSVPAPIFAAWFLALLELVGGVAVLLGVYTRIFAGFLAIEMIVAFALTKQGLPSGDLDFALFAIAAALALTGPGKWALIKSCKGKCCSSGHCASGKCTDCKCGNIEKNEEQSLTG